MIRRKYGRGTRFSHQLIRIVAIGSTLKTDPPQLGREVGRLLSYLFDAKLFRIFQQYAKYSGAFATEFSQNALVLWRVAYGFMRRMETIARLMPQKHA